VHTLILQIVGNPSSVDEDAGGLAVLIQVGVEGSDDLDALFTAEDLINLDFLGMVENAFDCNWFHVPLLLELVKVLRIAPQEVAFVEGSNVNGVFTEFLLSTLDFHFFIFTTTLLVLSALLHENESWHGNHREHNLLFVHFFLIIIHSC